VEHFGTCFPGVEYTSRFELSEGGSNVVGVLEVVGWNVADTDD